MGDWEPVSGPILEALAQVHGVARETWRLEQADRGLLLGAQAPPDHRIERADDDAAAILLPGQSFQAVEQGPRRVPVTLSTAKFSVSMTRSRRRSGLSL